jgi:hypothetical protein
MDSSGAVPVVRVSGDPPMWALEALGVLRAEPDVGFSRVHAIALDPRGGVWVADIGERRVSRYGDDGKWIEDRGRVGSGPGEFRVPWHVALHDGALLVHDPGNRRMLRFDLESGSDSSWFVRSNFSSDALTFRLFPNPDGPLLSSRVMGDGPVRLSFLQLRDSSVRTALLPGGPPPTSKECEQGETIWFFDSPFAPRAFVVPIGEGLVRTKGDSYELEYVDAAGEPVRTVVRVQDRDSIRQSEFDSATTEWREFERTNNTLLCTGSIQRFRFKPAIRALLPDAQGRLWVETRQPGGFVYDVWSGDSLIARVPSPAREPDIPPAMLGDRLAVVAESRDGGHEVRLYRIRRD